MHRRADAPTKIVAACAYYCELGVEELAGFWHLPFDTSPSASCLIKIGQAFPI
jgi:hypothetical protein